MILKIFALLENVWNLLQNLCGITTWHVATLPWAIKNSSCLQIFSVYARKCKQIAF